MEKEILEVKQALYAGMSIYKELMNSIVEVNSKNLSLEDKKYMSLYLGLLNTENSISNKLKEPGFRVYKKLNYKQLTKEEYINIYNEHFVEIFNQIDFNSIINYFEFLLNQSIVQNINKVFRFDVDKVLNKSHKQMVM